MKVSELITELERKQRAGDQDVATAAFTAAQNRRAVQEETWRASTDYRKASS